MPLVTLHDFKSAFDDEGMASTGLDQGKIFGQTHFFKGGRQRASSRSGPLAPNSLSFRNQRLPEKPWSLGASVLESGLDPCPGATTMASTVWVSDRLSKGPS